MLKDEKWITYAVMVLKVASSGRTTKQISEEIGGSPSYLAKVVAVLRRGGLLDVDTEPTRPLDKISISELIQLADRSPIDNPLSRIIVRNLLAGVENLSVKQVLQENGVAI